MPFEKMSRSSGKVLGLKVTGRVKKEDYEGLTKMVREVVDREGEVDLLLDMEEFDWAEISAWGADWRFSREFHDNMKRLAIIGCKRWQRFAIGVASCNKAHLLRNWCSSAVTHLKLAEGGCGRCFVIARVLPQVVSFSNVVVIIDALATVVHGFV